MKTRERIISASKRYQNGVNEGGDGYNPYYDRSDATQERIMAAAMAEHWAEWTLDRTIDRRVEWNTAAKTLRTPRDVQDLQERVGYRVDDLKEAIKHYAL